MAKKKIDFVLSAVNNTKRSFDAVTGGLGKMAGVAGTATKGIAAVGLAAAGTATAIAILVDKSFQAVDAIGKTSTQTGIATDTLQAFHLAARESGTSIEGANTALIKFARTVGDADKGLKTQADIFKDLGINLRDTTGQMRAFDDILVDTAKGISAMGSQSERASALAGLFGRQGVILTGAIKDLSEKGLDKFIDRAKKLGVVLAGSVIRRTEEFNDRIGVLQMQFKALVANITTSLLPIFEKMQRVASARFQKMIDDAKGMDQLGLNIANGIIEGVAKGIEALGDFADGLFNIMQSGKIQVLGFQRTFLDLNKTILQVANKFTDMTVEIELLNAQILDNAGKTLDAKNATSNYGDVAGVVADKLRSYKLSIDQIRVVTDMLTNSTDDLTTKLVNIGSPLEVFIASLGKEGLAKTIETTTVGAMTKFEDSIIETIKTGKLSFKSFADFVIEQMLRIAVQQMVIKPLTGSFESFFANFGSKFGNKALGGSANAGTPYMVGESGRELFVPSQSGQIVSNSDLNSSGGGSTTVNFNISTVDAAGFDDLLQSRKGLITQIINNSMNKQGKMGIL